MSQCKAYHQHPTAGGGALAICRREDGHAGEHRDTSGCCWEGKSGVGPAPERAPLFGQETRAAIAREISEIIQREETAYMHMLKSTEELLARGRALYADLQKQARSLELEAKRAGESEVMLVEAWDTHSHKVCDALGTYYSDDGSGFAYDTMVEAITRLREDRDNAQRQRDDALAKLATLIDSAPPIGTRHKHAQLQADHATMAETLTRAQARGTELHNALVEERTFLRSLPSALRTCMGNWESCDDLKDVFELARSIETWNKGEREDS